MLNDSRQCTESTFSLSTSLWVFRGGQGGAGLTQIDRVAVVNEVAGDDKLVLIPGGGEGRKRGGGFHGPHGFPIEQVMARRDDNLHGVHPAVLINDEMNQKIPLDALLSGREGIAPERFDFAFYFKKVGEIFQVLCIDCKGVAPILLCKLFRQSIQLLRFHKGEARDFCFPNRSRRGERFFGKETPCLRHWLWGGRGDRDLQTLWRWKGCRNLRDLLNRAVEGGTGGPLRGGRRGGVCRGRIDKLDQDVARRVQRGGEVRHGGQD